MIVNMNKSKLLRDIEYIINEEKELSQSDQDRLYTEIKEKIESFCWELQENLGRAFTNLD